MKIQDACERHRIYRRRKWEFILWCDSCAAPLASEHHQVSTEVLRLCQVCRLVTTGKFGDEPVEDA